jgi:hypothetical protein
MHPVSDLFAGAFLCNSLPHLMSGLQGLPFPTPFATPHGVGNSSAMVNALWGNLNLAVGLGLLAWHPIAWGLNPDLGLVAAGFLLLSIFAGGHFGKVMSDRAAVKSSP